MVIVHHSDSSKESFNVDSIDILSPKRHFKISLKNDNLVIETFPESNPASRKKLQVSTQQYRIEILN